MRGKKLFFLSSLAGARRGSRGRARDPELEQLREGLGKVLKEELLVLGVGVDVRPELAVPDEGLRRREEDSSFFCRRRRREFNGSFLS